jgi:hypothetical protein
MRSGRWILSFPGESQISKAVCWADDCSDVGSLPGYMYSSPPPTDREYDFDDVARLMHNLMLGLGYKEYITQGESAFV